MFYSIISVNSKIHDTMIKQNVNVYI